MPEVGGEERLVTANIELSPRARTFVTKFRESFGVFQKAGVERVLEFVASLPLEAQQEVFREGGDPVGRLVALRLAEAAGAGDAPTIEQSVAIIRQQLERLERTAVAYRRE